MTRAGPFDVRCSVASFSTVALASPPPAACTRCRKALTLKKRFNWLAFLAWTFLTGGVGIVVYPLVYAAKKPDACSTCGLKSSSQTGYAVASKAGQAPPAQLKAPPPDASAAYAARSRKQMQSEVLPGEIDRAVGYNGTVVVFQNRISITRRKGISNALLHGKKGDKEIRLSKLSSVQLAKPSKLTRGYIQFEGSGSAASGGGLFDAVKDENTVMIDAKQFPDFVRIKQVIDGLLDALERRDASPAAAAPQSVTTELQEWQALRASGAITDAEFATKKAEILSRR